MHPNQHFRKETDKQNIAFAKERAFGTLAINAATEPLLSHVPFILSENGKNVELHLVRSNPILKLLSNPQNAVISVLGGDAYLSPDWYEVDDQVPTWNYVAVHIRGSLSLLPQGEIHEVLNRLSQSMEFRLLPKTPWTSDKMDEEIYQKMLRQIVPVKMDVREINGTWKLSQNKPDAVRLAAADAVETSDLGTETKQVSDLMRKAGEL